MPRKKTCRAKSPATCRCKPETIDNFSSFSNADNNKTCSKCRRNKPVTEFYIREGRRYHSECKKCHNERTLKRYYNRLTDEEKERFDQAQKDKVMRARGFKICSRCNEEKALAEYLTKAGKEKYQICVSCRPENQREYLAANPEIEAQRRSKDQAYRAYVVEVTEELKRKGCADCGRYLPESMDFDHTCPPEEKLYNINRIHLQGGASTRLKEMLAKELAKGEYVCVNCHRKRTMFRQANNRRVAYFKDPDNANINENARYAYGVLSSSKCIDCNTDDFLVLEFDHVRGKKIKDITRMTSNHSGSTREEIDEEIAKCDVRCANCHRKRTYLRGLGHEKTEQIPKDKTSTTCNCGKNKNANASVCLDCSKKNKAEAAQSRYGSIESLIKKLRSASYFKVAKTYGVSDNALRKYVKASGFDPKTFAPIDLTTNE